MKLPLIAQIMQWTIFVLKGVLEMRPIFILGIAGLHSTRETLGMHVLFVTVVARVLKVSLLVERPTGSHFSMKPIDYMQLDL
ncbi:hypothetical protein TU73_00325 [Pseudomonas libanensis]|uniref:Uncharacterized protein n=1 Tax=Pseudomonas libanensis TaxID=75588 RepID=A0A0R2YRM1_9PSED|nr:hypothetical protein TU73_00325 [Pseudomonas libanensis]